MNYTTFFSLKTLEYPTYYHNYNFAVTIQAPASYNPTCIIAPNMLGRRNTLKVRTREGSIAAEAVRPMCYRSFCVPGFVSYLLLHDNLPQNLAS